MKPFETFALLYMTALYLELSEVWDHTLFTAAMLGVVVVLALTRVTRVAFFAFLTAATAYFLVTKFPDVANHVNALIYCNLALMSGVAYSLVRRNAVRSDDDWFEMMRPVLQLSLVLVYFLAGFHKLNADFFDPDVSCVSVTMQRMWRMTQRDLLGLPAGAVLAAGTAATAVALVASSPRRRRYLPLVGAGAAAVALFAALVVFAPPGALPSPTGPWTVVPMIALILLWEVAGGPLLAVPRLQLPVLAFSWSMHASLALIDFVDFGSLALALLFSFVPRAYQEMAGERVGPAGWRLRPSRPQLYVALCALVGIVNSRNRLAAGILFNVAALVLIWPMLSALVGTRPRPAWPGVPITARLTPRWMLALPALLVLHAGTSYLGLRTAGNFSMFSNLRTEGPRSNHLLLGGNPLKLWGYQEDAVRFLRIDDRAARIGYQYQPLLGNSLPVVEFRKLIYWWTRAGRAVPMTIEYQGAVHTTSDITKDPPWRTTRRDWSMRLMDFRSIQPGGPNRCRW